MNDVFVKAKEIYRVCPTSWKMLQSYSTCGETFTSLIIQGFIDSPLYMRIFDCWVEFQRASFSNLGFEKLRDTLSEPLLARHPQPDHARHQMASFRRIAFQENEYRSSSRLTVAGSCGICP